MCHNHQGNFVLNLFAHACSSLFLSDLTTETPLTLLKLSYEQRLFAACPQDEGVRHIGIRLQFYF
jgi:hypothetical protein